MAKKSGFMKGAVLGGLVGSLAGLLFAPKSGKETQEDLKRKARTMKSDIDTTLTEMQRDLVGRIDDLKDVAKELGGEAREESQGLITRAELLKKDLSSSASNLTKASGEVRDSAIGDAKRLLDDGAAVMAELERVTKKMVGSAKGKVRSGKDSDKSGNDSEV
jgi:gas vesicle protein